MNQAHMEQGYSIRYLSSYFGYTRDGYYKSISRISSVELSKAMLITSVMAIRRQHPRMGGKKMYYLLRDLSKELHTGRDKFFEIL
ncbi:MAG: hypothetical protein LBE04_01595, partial [Prevotellaceae bacterium]|nr:hypothetical protein [Prevotellaceae bacterium]